MTSEPLHTPVLLAEILEALQPGAGRRYIDATLGRGGHAEKILDMSNPDGLVLGIDADPEAIRETAARLARFDGRLTLAEGYFDRMGDIAAETGFDAVDGILFDLGVSSPQLDRAERGFSFQHDAPLDMRFGPSATRSAADLVNDLDADGLKRIFSAYGEERYSGRIARRIVEARRTHPIRSTTQLARIVVDAQPHTSREAIHPATRVFQALRIAVNDELGRLERALPQAVELLEAGGRVAVISFHSLEDRIVKRFLRREATDCICPPELPTCVCGHRASVRLLTKKPIEASPAEVAANPRARSAKLRVAERLSL